MITLAFVWGSGRCRLESLRYNGENRRCDTLHPTRDTNQKTVGEMGEYALLEWLNARLPKSGHGVIVPSGDDAAVVDVSEAPQLIITTDTLVENVHFRHDWSSPRDVARKLVSMNSSDIAAMGGTPNYAVIATTFPGDLRLDWLDAFYNELRSIGDETGLVILGGDTTGGDLLVLTLTMTGSVEPGKAVRFSTARAGDSIVVTGQLGASRAGLEILSSSEKEAASASEEACVRKHCAPDSRWRIATDLVRLTNPTAMTDISDGLGRDLVKMAGASGLGFRVTVDAIPVHADALQVAKGMKADPVGWAICSGEEFELLLTVREPGVSAASEQLGVPLMIIGTMTNDPSERVWIHSDGSEYNLATKCFEHFK